MNNRNENWIKCKISDLGEVIGGATPSTSNENYYGGDIPWITPKDLSIQKSRFISKGERNITLEGLNSCSAKLLPKGSILFSSRAPIGYITIADNPVTTNQGFKSIILNKDVHNIFVYYLLTYNKINIESKGSGTTFKEVSGAVMKNIEVCIPKTKEEQKRIADVLSALDDKIEINNKINENLEAQAQAIFKQWFVDEAKEDWEVGVLGDVLELIESGSRPKGGIDPNLKDGIASIGAESINGIGIYDFSKTKYVNKEFYKSMNRGLIKDYDILIYKDGAYIGRKGMFGNGFPFETALVNEHVFILRTNNRLNQLYLYFALEQEKLKQLNTNSAQPGLNQTSMKSLKILIPPKNILDRFEETIKPLIGKILYNSKENKNLSEIRDSLLPKLMNGEIRV